MSGEVSLRVEGRKFRQIGRKHQRVLLSIPSGLERHHREKRRTVRSICVTKLEQEMKRCGERQPTAEDHRGQLDLLIYLIRSAGPTPSRKEKSHDPWYDDVCRTLKQSCLENIGQPEYGTLRRIYKSTIKRKRLDYELEVLRDQVIASRKEPGRLLPSKQRPVVPPVPLEELEIHFRALFESTSTTEISGTEDAWHNDPFSNDEVTKMLQHTKNGKATGPDNIAIDTIKKSSPFIIPLVTRPFNSILMTGQIRYPYCSSFSS